MPKFSIVVPIYNMDNAWELLQRNLDSIRSQSFTDYEIVVTDDSEDDDLKIKLRKHPIRYIKNTTNHSMADNSNFAMDHAKGELIKILYQDDYFAHSSSLQEINEHFTSNFNWLVTGCLHNYEGKIFNPHHPFYSESENTIGSPSVLTIRKSVTTRFDSTFHWVLDLDLYKQLFREYGRPKILNDLNVIIGLHKGQKTNLLSDHRKQLEHQLLKQKYDTSS